MSILFNLLFAGKATGTHHKLALDALLHFQRHDDDEWRNVFLAEIDRYLAGAKAPDVEFKDFRNHVLHVRENHWGGAIAKAQEWYGKTVQSLSKRDWPEAVYSAGVLSHYFTDPYQPFHTGQSEREMIIHRAAEWSINKSYEELQALLKKELGGYPEVKLASGDDWLAQLIRHGATQANASYDLLIDHYNFNVGVKNPILGFDREAKVAIAKLIGLATVSLSRVLEKAIGEAGVLVPHVVVGFQSMFESMQAPMRAIAKRMHDARERTIVEAMYAEFQKTGKVIDTLPDDDKTLRRLHAEEVLKIPVAQLDQQQPGPIGAKYSGVVPQTKPVAKPVAQPSAKPAAATAATAKPTDDSAKPVTKPAPKRDDLTPPKLAPTAAKPSKPLPTNAEVESAGPARSRLVLASPLVDAPSIGPKTAERFVPLGIRTVGEFLSASADSMSRSLNLSHVTTEVLEEWQDQTQLILDVPRLIGRDAQVLVGVGIRTSDDLARCHARELLDLVKEFCETSSGKRILREAQPPDLVEVSQWVIAAKKNRVGKAA